MSFLKTKIISMVQVSFQHFYNGGAILVFGFPRLFSSHLRPRPTPPPLSVFRGVLSPTLLLRERKKDSQGVLGTPTAARKLRE